MNQAIELDHEQSSRVLQCACRAEADIILRPKAWAQQDVLQASLMPAAGPTLKLSCQLPENIVAEQLLNMYCELELSLEDGRYFFDSHVTIVRQHEAALELSLSWPRKILVNQRRRSSRMATSSTVQLSRDQGQRLLSCEGQVYNLSEDGMAFKLHVADAHNVELGQVWWACFELPGQEHCYKVKGTMSRKLPSSEHDAVIVGMEFEHDPAEQHEIGCLRDYLREHQSAHNSMGVRP